MNSQLTLRNVKREVVVPALLEIAIKAHVQVGLSYYLHDGLVPIQYGLEPILVYVVPRKLFNYRATSILQAIWIQTQELVDVEQRFSIDVVTIASETVVVVLYVCLYDCSLVASHAT